VKTFSEVAAWLTATAQDFDDPCEPICQLFVRWQDDANAPLTHEDLVCGWLNGELALRLVPDMPPLPFRIETGQFRLGDAGELQVFGADQVARGLWEITPSLNVQGLIHAFLVIYEVPDPAPWERRIVLPAGVSHV
jgi:hypothetical protein